MSGDGPAADAAGNIYLLTGNGPFETTLNGAGFPSGGDYGNSFLRITSGSGGLAVADYFAMSNEVAESGADRDLGSGGEMLLPDVTDGSGGVQHLVVGAGKDQNIYVVDRDNMGKYSATANNIWQQLNGAAGGGVFSSPAYFNDSVYYGRCGCHLARLRTQQCEALELTRLAKQCQLRLSGHIPCRLRQRQQQWDRLGAREQLARRAACVRCQQPGA